MYNQLNRGRDNGLIYAPALDFIVNQGSATLARMPYDDGDYLTQPSAAAHEEASYFKAKSWKVANGILEAKEALANRVLLLEQGKLVATLTPVELLARLLPEVELTLWVPAAQRQDALSCLTGAGWAAHFNGRGTVVVRVRAEHKLKPLRALEARGIQVSDFDIARGAAWN